MNSDIVMNSDIEKRMIIAGNSKDKNGNGNTTLRVL